MLRNQKGGARTLLLVEWLLLGAGAVRTLASHLACIFHTRNPYARLTIISCILLLMPARETFWRYLRPAKISCWTLNWAFMRNVAPSLIVNGFFSRASTAPGDRRSMMMSSRPSTSRPSERMMHLRGSLGSEMSLPWPRPREAFHFWRDSSFLSRFCRAGQRLSHVQVEHAAACLVLVDGLLLADLEALGLLCLEVVVVVRHICCVSTCG